jgi:hypothetical protein
MQHIVINKKFGGFGLSDLALEEYNKISDVKVEYDFQIETRDDPALVRVVNMLGAKANGSSADLWIVGIPDDVKWTIKEYDGNEHVAEVHRTWS